MNMTEMGISEPPPEREKSTIRTSRGDVLSRNIIGKEKVIFHEGHDGTDVFIVESGRVGVFKNINGKQVQLAALEKGAVFGEMAAITGGRRSATTLAIEPSIIVRIPKSMIQSKLNSCDPFIRAIMQILIHNLNGVNELYVVEKTVVDKLIRELKSSAEKATMTSHGGGPNQT